MTLILSGTSGLSDVDGSAATPAIRGTDANTGIFFPAADTIAFSEGGTEAMRIDSSGNVGIGTSSPLSRLDVREANRANGTNIANIGIYTTTAQGADVGGTFSLGGLFDGTNYAPFGSIRGGKANATSGNYDGYLAFQTILNNSVLTERMRIDASGNLLVGTTDSGISTGNGVKILPAGSGPSTVSSFSTNAYSCLHMYSSGASAYRFYVGWGGTIYATSTTITAISDQRLKENIRDLDDGLDVVMALKPRKFDWKEGKGQDIKNARGFIAQEFETVLPDMIEEWKDPAPEGEEPYKAVNANLIPTLVKAIQELKALVDTQASTITALQADVAALKAQP